MVESVPTKHGSRVRFPEGANFLFFLFKGEFISFFPLSGEKIFIISFLVSPDAPFDYKLNERELMHFNNKTKIIIFLNILYNFLLLITLLYFLCSNFN